MSPYFGFILLSLTLFADCPEIISDCPDQKPLWEKWNPPEKKPSEKCTTLSNTRLYENSRFAANYKKKEEDRGSPFAGASVLVWQSKMWGFEFGAKSFIPTNQSSPNITLDEKVYVPDFAWRPGFKLNVGYLFAFDGWDVDSRWTWYKGETTHLKKNIDLQTNPPGMGVPPLWFYPFYTVLSPDQIRYKQSHSSFRHYFDSIDLQLGRLSLATPKTTWHLFTGLKGAWMHEYYKVQYEDGITIDAIIPGASGATRYRLLDSAIQFSNKSWGVGPRFGFDTRWKLGYGTSVITNLAFSLLYSSLHTHRDQNDLNLDVITDEPITYHADIKTHSHLLKPVLEAQIGSEWNYQFYTKSTIGMKIAYEMQYWWSQNNIRRNYSYQMPGGTFSSRGDLQMHGLTATISYGY